jgi:hypothetical protein
MYKVTGNTYEVRARIKQIGYTYTGKAWIGESREPFDALMAKWRKPGYGVSFAKLADRLGIEEVSVVTCEI